MLAQEPRIPTLEHLIHLKKVWADSLVALTYRLHAVGAISDWRYQTLFVELSSRGYRKKEPDEGQRETSQVLQKVFAALRKKGVWRASIARELCIPADELDQLVFSLGAGRP